MPATGRAAAFVQALGGAGNLKSVDACATRLRLIVASQDAVDERALKQLGARATVKVSSEALQVVLGPIADQIADEIRAQIRVPVGVETVPRRATEHDGMKPVVTLSREVMSGLLSALGGRANVRDVEAVASSRLRVTVVNAAAVDDRAIRSLGLRGIARPTTDGVHVLVGPGADEALTLFRTLLAS
jgi:PTS system N-acetylglucosamine-specific IIC component